MSATDKTVVISQPMVFPWVGLFEQVRLADVFVHYDDVQFPQGRSFTNRVQIKMPGGNTQWLTIPVKRDGKQLIQDVLLDNAQDWKGKHLKTLQHAYAKAPFRDDMLTLVEQAYQYPTEQLSTLNIQTLEMVARYFGFEPEFALSSSLGTTSHSTQKLLDITRQMQGTRYVTGHGARHYMDHDLFESSGIRVEYMQYQCMPYPQCHGDFTPYVSILDLIANCGTEGQQYICSRSINWKAFLHDTNHEPTQHEPKKTHCTVS